MGHPLIPHVAIHHTRRPTVCKTATNPDNSPLSAQVPNLIPLSIPESPQRRIVTGMSDRKLVTAILLLGCLLVVWTGVPILAQEPGAAPLPAPVAPGRPMWIDGGITVTLIGLALFVVCRGSHRV